MTLKPVDWKLKEFKIKVPRNIQYLQFTTVEKKKRKNGRVTGRARKIDENVKSCAARCNKVPGAMYFDATRFALVFSSRHVYVRVHARVRTT